ncbi:MAG: Alanine dehydrogenase [Verrucomicrobiales bacterium]|nr:Alanine dehydrogenase [Verrucomicrobiales bacterium]
MKDFRRILHAAVTERDHPWCLATLVRSEGSSYRQPGARLLVRPDGRGTIGFLSAGCLEEEIAQQGAGVLADGVPKLVFFDTRRLFGCDGRLWVYMEKIPAAGEKGNFLTQMADRAADRALCRIMVPYSSGEASELVPDKALIIARDGVFSQTVTPPPRLIVFGEGPEVAPLAAFAGGLGWDFQCYPHPDELPESFRGDAFTAAVVMTHKFGRDLAALHRLFPLSLRYIGLLGSKKRHHELLNRFAEFQGGNLPPEWLEVLHAPAGLDTASESPEEIAFSILAEAAAVLAGRQGGFLKAKTTAIHRMEMEASA